MYKIGQAAKLLDVKPFVLRFWESEFKDVLVPVRTPAGQRAYTEQNVNTVREIKRLLYDEGLTIEGAKKRLSQLHGPVVRTSIGSPAPASPEQSGIAFTSVGAAAKPAQTVKPALATDPSSPLLAFEAAPEVATKASAEANALRGTLRDVERELLRIRDLLGA